VQSTRTGPASSLCSLVTGVALGVIATLAHTGAISLRSLGAILLAMLAVTMVGRKRVLRHHQR